MTKTRAAMTEQDEQKLIEVVAREECRVEGVDPDLKCVGLGNLIPVGEVWSAWKVRARRVEAALRAIDASGTHCVLPVAARDLLYREAHFAQFYDKARRTKD